MISLESIAAFGADGQYRWPILPITEQYFLESTQYFSIQYLDSVNLESNREKLNPHGSYNLKADCLLVVQCSGRCGASLQPNREWPPSVWGLFNGHSCP